VSQSVVAFLRLLDLARKEGRGGREAPPVEKAMQTIDPWRSHPSIRGVGALQPYAAAKAVLGMHFIRSLMRHMPLQRRLHKVQKPIFSLIKEFIKLPRRKNPRLMNSKDPLDRLDARIRPDRSKARCRAPDDRLHHDQAGPSIPDGQITPRRNRYENDVGSVEKWVTDDPLITLIQCNKAMTKATSKKLKPPHI
jgi:hypothetical protein